MATKNNTTAGGINWLEEHVGVIRTLGGRHEKGDFHTLGEKKKIGLLLPHMVNTRRILCCLATQTT